MKRRDFLKSAAALTSVAVLPSCATLRTAKKERFGLAHIGVGGMGASDLDSMSSHGNVEVVALCDVDTNMLAAAKEKHPDAKVFSDYRKLLEELGGAIDGVMVSTPDHTHAPASIMAMEMGKPVYCQKPLTHHVSESRAMAKLAKEKNLVTQMGIQVHSSYAYKLATMLIRDGIIGKVSTVRAWSPKNWGYDGLAPDGNDPIPSTLDWNLWLGTAPERPYKENFYHPANWRKIMDYGCGTLGDMGVHIFDTPYNALELDVPKTISTSCRQPNGFGFPEKNTVTYEFPGTQHTAETLKWVWYDGKGAPSEHKELMLPDNEKLPGQGAMFVGEKGNLLLPHYEILPRLIVDGKYEDLDMSEIQKTYQLGSPSSDSSSEQRQHYHDFVDACMGKGECLAPFSYAARLTETILLGVIAGRFPDKTLHWDRAMAKFTESEANQFLDAPYRSF